MLEGVRTTDAAPNAFTVHRRRRDLLPPGSSLREVRSLAHVSSQKAERRNLATKACPKATSPRHTFRLLALGPCRTPVHGRDRVRQRLSSFTFSANIVLEIK